mgnify:CR=1 FL=1
MTHVLTVHFFLLMFYNRYPLIGVDQTFSIKLFQSTVSINTSTELNFPKKAPAGYTPKQQTLSVRNTVGYRGVSSNKCKGYKVVNYQAQITLGGCHVYIGNYDTILEGKSIFNYPSEGLNHK